MLSCVPFPMEMISYTMIARLLIIYFLFFHVVGENIMLHCSNISMFLTFYHSCSDDYQHGNMI